MKKNIRVGILFLFFMISIMVVGCAGPRGNVRKKRVARTESKADFEKRIAEEKNDKASEEYSEYKAAYRECAQKYYDDHKSNETEYCKVRFDLIYFDEDDIPELVAGVDSYYVNVYTYRDGSVQPILEDYGYGVGGNAGYYYYPKRGIIHCVDNDMAGAMQYYFYEQLNPGTLQMEPLYEETLNVWTVRDKNGDGSLDWEEVDSSDGEYMSYHYGNKEISYEEFNKYIVDGPTEYLCGEMDIETVLQNLF